MEFGKRIYELRKKRGYTQEQIAEKVDVSRQTISNWETGSVQPTIDKVIALSSLYEISIDELVADDSTSNKVSNKILKYLLNKTLTLYLDINAINTYDEIVLMTSKIKECKILDVKTDNITVQMKYKKQTIEKVFFIKDINGFELEVF